jgi:hypothetical protein
MRLRDQTKLKRVLFIGLFGGMIGALYAGVTLPVKPIILLKGDGPIPGKVLPAWYLTKEE